MLDVKKKDLFFIIAVPLSIILWAYFLSASGFSLERIIHFNQMWQTLGVLKSLNFILFVLVFPTTFAFAITACRVMDDKQKTIIFVLSSALIGLLLSVAVFNLWQYWLIGAFYLLSFVLAIEMTYVRMLELKKYVSLRLLNEGTHRSITIMGIGLFIAILLIVMPMQDKLVKEMESEMTDIVLGEQGSQDVAEASVNLLVNSQKATYMGIMQLEGFEATKSSTDPKAQEFALGIEAQAQYIETPEYRQKILEQVKEKQGTILQGEEFQSLFDKIKQKMPLYSLLTNLFWIIEPIIIVSLFFLIGSIIITPLAIFYGLIMSTIASATKEQQ